MVTVDEVPSSPRPNPAAMPRRRGLNRARTLPRAHNIAPNVFQLLPREKVRSSTAFIISTRRGRARAVARRRARFDGRLLGPLGGGEGDRAWLWRLYRRVAAWISRDGVGTDGGVAATVCFEACAAAGALVTRAREDLGVSQDGSKGHST
jgi:hypothetical protein